MSAPCKVEFYLDRKFKARWRLKARNGRVVADSGQGYDTIEGAKKGFKIVMGAATNRQAFMVDREGNRHRIHV